MKSTPKMKKPLVRRTRRTDQILHLKQRYEGDLHGSPLVYNQAFAGVLRAMADKLESIDDAWADPQITVWAHVPGEISAELMLSEPEKE